jgi:two-component system, LytTR family, response regulator
MQKEIIRAIIVEDEENSRQNLIALLQNNCPNVQILAQAESIVQAVATINKHRSEIDLAFLDVKLSDGEIFMLLDLLEKIDFDIIFISAYKDSAHMGYKYSAIDFIPKPIDVESLKNAVERSRSRLENKTNERLDVLRQTIDDDIDKITISTMDSFHFVKLNEIVRMEGHDNYTFVFLKDGERLTSSRTIKVYEELLMQKNFFRVHKSHIINVEHMKKFMKGDGGSVIMADGKEIDVSRRRRPFLIDFLKKQNPDFL